MSEHYVYVFLDPRRPGTYKFDSAEFDHEPFYVGKGRGNRAQNNLRSSKKRNPSTAKELRIHEILAEGRNVIVVKVVTELTNEAAFELEAKLIDEIKRTHDGGTLTNVAKGWNGGWGHSADTKQIIAEKKRLFWTEERRHELSERQRGENNCNFGKHHSEEHKRKVSEKLKASGHHPKWIDEGGTHPRLGAVLSDEQKQRQSEIMKEYYAKGGRKPNIRTYIVTDPSGTEHVVSNLPEFCCKYNLNYQTMRARLDRGSNSNWKIRYA